MSGTPQFAPALIALDNDWTIRWKLTDVDAGAPLSGVVPTAFLSATAGAGATPIDPALSLALTEAAPLPTGDYSRVIAGATITAKLGALVGQVIYEICTVGTSVRRVRALQVVDALYADNA